MQIQKMIGVESCAKIWGSFSAYVHDDHFCVNHDDAYARDILADGPIEMTHPSNKKLLDKMEKESAKMKKELLAIDAMERKNSSKSLKKST